MASSSLPPLSPYLLPLLSPSLPPSLPPSLSPCQVRKVYGKDEIVEAREEMARMREHVMTEVCYLSFPTQLSQTLLV